MRQRANGCWSLFSSSSSPTQKLLTPCFSKICTQLSNIHVIKIYKFCTSTVIIKAVNSNILRCSAEKVTQIRGIPQGPSNVRLHLAESCHRWNFDYEVVWANSRFRPFYSHPLLNMVVMDSNLMWRIVYVHLVFLADFCSRKLKRAMLRHSERMTFALLNSFCSLLI